MFGFDPVTIDITDRRTYARTKLTVEIDNMNRIVIGSQSHVMGAVLQLSEREAQLLTRALAQATNFLRK